MMRRSEPSPAIDRAFVCRTKPRPHASAALRGSQGPTPASQSSFLSISQQTEAQPAIRQMLVLAVHDLLADLQDDFRRLAATLARGRGRKG
ncbi:hypothetical protein N182_24025 [Sinorhizobium sp. GL2]|nr:hypothetical protein N182_24025 [Sinorhizobium sp. GL2]